MSANTLMDSVPIELAIFCNLLCGALNAYCERRFELLDRGFFF